MALMIIDTRVTRAQCQVHNPLAEYTMIQTMQCHRSAVTIQWKRTRHEEHPDHITHNLSLFVLSPPAVSRTRNGVSPRAGAHDF